MTNIYQALGAKESMLIACGIARNLPILAKKRGSLVGQTHTAKKDDEVML